MKILAYVAWFFVWFMIHSFIFTPVFTSKPGMAVMIIAGAVNIMLLFGGFVMIKRYNPGVKVEYNFKEQMEKKKFIIIALLVIGVAGGAWYSITPHTYEDCMLQGMKGVSSDLAARGVEVACSQKFQKYISEEEAFRKPKN